MKYRMLREDISSPVDVQFCDDNIDNEWVTKATFMTFEWVTEYLELLGVKECEIIITKTVKL